MKEEVCSDRRHFRLVGVLRYNNIYFVAVDHIGPVMLRGFVAIAKESHIMKFPSTLRRLVSRAQNSPN